MELIEVELTEFTRRSRSVVVSHRAAGVRRGLEYGERLLVRTGGEYRTAIVADIDFDLDDTTYRMILGGVVPADLAEERLAGDVPAVPGRVSVHDIADMLARSGSAYRIPVQRRTANRLLFDR
jgi:hypothetical protein